MNYEKLKFEIYDNIRVDELKLLYMKQSKLSRDITKIRIFYHGAELNDNFKLYQYNITDGVTLNVMIRQ